jgi:putative transposase
MIQTFVELQSDGKASRLNLPYIAQHLVQRGKIRQASFYAEQNYIVYLNKLKDYGKKYKVAVHAYLLMTNHVYLLVPPETEKGVSQLIQSLDRYYVEYINNTYQSYWSGSQVEKEHSPISLD